MKDEDPFLNPGILPPGRHHFDVPPLNGRRRDFQRSMDVSVYGNDKTGFFSTLIWLHLKGPSGGVQFNLLWPYKMRIGKVALYSPYPVDIGIHSPKPLYDGHEMREYENVFNHL